ncbi:hypothetical protein V2O64_17955 [Verrucomicrobiaceae bacterium 227]
MSSKTTLITSPVFSSFRSQLPNLKLLPLLGALSLLTPSCDSSRSASAQEIKEKPNAKHHSTATLEFHYTRPYDPDFVQEQSANFLNNQIAIISASSVIKQAADESSIDPKVIQEALWIEPIENTDLIHLTAYHDDEASAKAIAEAVIKAYVSHRNTLEHERANNALQALDIELINQGDLVQDQRKTLTILIQQYGIPYFDGRNSNPVGATEEEMYRLAQKKLDDYETQRAQLEIQIQKVMTTANEDIIRMAAGMDLPENQVTEYYQSFRDLKNQIESKTASGLGEDHPSVVKLQQQADQKLEYARAEVVTLKQILDTKLMLIERQVEKMRQIVDSKQNITVELSLKQHNYNQAKEDYEQARDQFRNMKIKQQEARSMLNVPRTPVTIHGWSHY